MYEPLLLRLSVDDLRQLLHPAAAATQGLHVCEQPQPPAMVPFSEEVLRLRQAVMWPEQPLEYSAVGGDDDPAVCVHLGIMSADGGQLLSVLSLCNEVSADGQQRRVAQFRKFCTDPAWQGRGLGSRLLRCGGRRAAALAVYTRVEG